MRSTPTSRDSEPLRQRLVNRTPKYGNDDDARTTSWCRVFEIDLRRGRRPAQRQGRPLPDRDAAHHLPRLLRLGDWAPRRTDAGPGQPLSEGISPVQGADRQGPTAVIKSAAKMDHVKTGGTLLNMKFTPSLLAGRERASTSWPTWSAATSSWTGTTCSSTWSAPTRLREAQAEPERPPRPDRPRGRLQRLLLRPVGELQDEIIARTEHDGF